MSDVTRRNRYTGLICTAALSALISMGPLTAVQAQDDVGTEAPEEAYVEEPVISGYDEFVRNCAVCHGMEGLGNGPMAEALKVPPTNLRLLAKNNGGEFPFLRVIDIIDNGGEAAAHGSPDMPAWGEAYRADVDPVTARALIFELMLHIESIQITE